MLRIKKKSSNLFPLQNKTARLLKFQGLKGPVSPLPSACRCQQCRQPFSPQLAGAERGQEDAEASAAAEAAWPFQKPLFKVDFFFCLVL